jgi:hypothetical protein
MRKEVETTEGDDEQQQQQHNHNGGGDNAATNTDNNNNSGNVHEVFSFWSSLMVAGTADADRYRYPSQSSILSRSNESWHSLTSTRTIQPPTVELLD